MELAYIGDDLGPDPPTATSTNWLDRADALLELSLQRRIAVEGLLDLIDEGRLTSSAAAGILPPTRRPAPT